MISPAIDRRRSPRYPVQQIAMIFANPEGAARYCLILDKSDGGVRLRATSDFKPPTEFFLRVADTKSRYQVVWRNGSILGAMLIN